VQALEVCHHLGAITMLGMLRSGKHQIEKRLVDVMLEKLSYKVHQMCMLPEAPM